MSNIQKEKQGVPRFAVILSSLVASSIFMVWTVLLIRSSEFIQGGYYFYDGLLLLSILLCAVFPLMAIAYKKWKYRSVRKYLVLLHSIGAVLSYALINLYLNLKGKIQEPPYILTGLFIQDCLILIIIQTIIYMVIFLINMLLILTPANYNTVSQKISLTKTIDGIKLPSVGVGEGSLRSNMPFVLVILCFAFPLLISAVSIGQIHEIGVLNWLYFGFIFTIIAAILTWWGSRGDFIPSPAQDFISSLRSDSGNFNQNSGSRIYGLLSIPVVAIIIYSILNINEFSSILSLVLIIANFLVIGLGRLIWDFKFQPEHKSSSRASKIYLYKLKSTFKYAGYNLYGGCLILCGTFFYTIDIDRYTELISYSRLFICIAIVFTVVLFLYRWISPQVFHIIACISLLSVGFIILSISDFAATTNWWQDPNNILDGFAFYQSWPHALLCAIPIGIVFATMFYQYNLYHLSTSHHGIHLEAQYLFFMLLFSAGLTFGHDNRYGGPHSNEFNVSAQNVYDNFEIIFLILVILTLLTIIFSLLSLYISIIKKRKKLNETEAELK
jgi:hypothetical protein